MKLTPQHVTIWSPYDTKTNYTIGTQYKKKKLEAPIWKGERVGNLRITSDQLETLNGEPLTYSLYSANDVRRETFGNVFYIKIIFDCIIVLRLII